MPSFPTPLHTPAPAPDSGLASVLASDWHRIWLLQRVSVHQRRNRRPTMASPLLVVADHGAIADHGIAADHGVDRSRQTMISSPPMGRRRACFVAFERSSRHGPQDRRRRWDRGRPRECRRLWERRRPSDHGGAAGHARHAFGQRLNVGFTAQNSATRLASLQNVCRPCRSSDSQSG